MHDLALDARHRQHEAETGRLPSRATAFAARSGPVLLAAAFIRTTRKPRDEDKYGKLLVLVVFLTSERLRGTMLLRTARTARAGRTQCSHRQPTSWQSRTARSPRLRGDRHLLSRQMRGAVHGQERSTAGARSDAGWEGGAAPRVPK